MELELPEEFVQVRRIDLSALVKEVKQLKDKIETNTLDAQLDLLCGASRMLTSTVVCKILGWSRATFNRRLLDEFNPIPMTKDGRDWVISREVFTIYYNETFNPQS
eukprot:TRINITY_DN10717_c0_g9_i1.p1 TRINITY_DN10717_c0_g9~~TRINITY_DN10717_c0_g9_i1.p1  ORF type:complete len:106 (+),score=11.25 TRINITY_DN10717_c0_g9_i1:380-697(+)